MQKNSVQKDEDILYYKKYEQYTDEELIKIIRDDDKQAQDYLMRKYKNLVRVKARAYFIIGADKEDIIQEGMIGLYKAIRDYNYDKHTTFYFFAELCINRQIITAIKAATRQKHIPLNSYVSLNKPVFEENCERTYIELLSEHKPSNPEELFIGREERQYIEEHMAEKLSELERRVLHFYLQGTSYLEIAAITKKDQKSIDNALQRVKRKVFKILEQKNLTAEEKYAKI